jgi:hypothetical protein
VLNSLTLPTKTVLGQAGWNFDALRLLAKKMKLDTKSVTEAKYAALVTGKCAQGVMKKFIKQHLPDARPMSRKGNLQLL